MSLIITNLSAQQLRRAANIKDKIQSLQNELEKIVGSSQEPITPYAARKKSKMSATGRARIAAVQKARWAKIRAEKK
jgi:hypothetical protein